MSLLGYLTIGFLALVFLGLLAGTVYISLPSKVLSDLEDSLKEKSQKSAID